MIKVDNSKIKNIETFSFNYEGEIFLGLLHQPVVINDFNQEIIVFLHGWAGYRTGPHDMFVKAAKALTDEGFYCLRFDFRGRGYSVGLPAFAATYRTMIEDLSHVLNFVKTKYPQKKINLIGICSGAKTALYQAKSADFQLNNLILLSCPLLRESTVVHTDLKNFWLLVLNYTNKLRAPDTYLRLFKGELNLKNILNQLISPFRALAYKIGKIKKIKKKENVNISFTSINGKVLNIFGEKDPESQEASIQVLEVLKRAKIRSDQVIIKGANHSFYSIHWENELINIVVDWLKNNSGINKLYT